MTLARRSILTGLLDTDTVTGFVGGSACTK